MSVLPDFPLFPDPLREDVFEKSKKTCTFCKQARGWIYTSTIYGEGDVGEATCCPWCIADGTAAKQGAFFHDGSIFPVLPGTPQLTAADRELVERRTPGFTTWQDHGWQICCGRACIYLGEADEGDLQGRWAGAVETIFKDDDFPEEEVEEMIEGIVKGGSPAAYVFKCQTCGKLHGFWDCD